MVAQVHRGVLKEGTEVAIKVIRPRIEEKMNADLTLIKLLARGRKPPQLTTEFFEIKGASPFIAFNLVDWKGVKPDVYDLTFYHFFMDHYSPQEVKRYEKMISSPLQVQVKAAPPCQE